MFKKILSPCANIIIVPLKSVNMKSFMVQIESSGKVNNREYIHVIKKEY